MKIQKCYITNGDSNTVRKTVDRNTTKQHRPYHPRQRTNQHQDCDQGAKDPDN